MQWGKLVINAAIGWVPDLFIAWAYAKYMDGGWPEFWTALIALQALYFALWLKRTVWAWPIFWIFGRRSMSKVMEKFFRDNNFPRPEIWVGDFDDYLQQILMDETIDANTRIKASFEHGTLNGLKATQNYKAVLTQLSFETASPDTTHKPRI